MSAKGADERQFGYVAVQLLKPPVGDKAPQGFHVHLVGHSRSPKSNRGTLLPLYESGIFLVAILDFLAMRSLFTPPRQRPVPVPPPLRRGFCPVSTGAHRPTEQWTPASVRLCSRYPGPSGRGVR